MGIPIDPFQAGTHTFHPRAMLKLVVYGYSYGIKSSRKLERAYCHNLFFLWLISGIHPDYRTTDRFRSENKETIKHVLKQTVKLCIKLGLIEGDTLFVDGSKFRANASIRYCGNNAHQKAGTKGEQEKAYKTVWQRSIYHYCF